MRLEVYSVRDGATGAFLQPFFARARGEALRSMRAAVNESGHPFQKNAGDYVLFYLGLFDDNSGLFIGGEPERVIGGFELVAMDQPSAQAGEVDRRLPAGLQTPR